jgi:putative ABC transport system permease protein
MINTLTRILRTSPGFNPDHLLAAEVRLTGEKYMDATQQDKTGLNLIHPSVAIFCRQALERVGSIPGVESVALVDWLPLSENPEPAFPGFTIAGRAAPPRAERPRVLLEGVSSNYLGLMGIPILRGRGITGQDTESSSPVVVINQAMARQFWPNQDPVGQTITFDSSPEERPRQIIGVVGNVKRFELVQEAEPEAYVNILQLPPHTMPGWTESRVHKTIVIRTQSVSPALIKSVRTVLSELAPDSPVFGMTRADQMVANSARQWRSLSQLLGIFAGVALLLAAMGIYGVISYSVGERSHELGLRMALGAQRKNVLRLVLGQAMILSIVGVMIGVAASFAAAPLLAEFLYGVKPYDLLTTFMVSSLLIAVTFLASYIPARHATAIDPLETLRHS